MSACQLYLNLLSRMIGCVFKFFSSSEIRLGENFSESTASLDLTGFYFLSKLSAMSCESKSLFKL